MDVLIVDDHPIIHQALSLAVDAVLPGARQHVAFNLTEALVCMEQLSGRQFDPALFTQFKAVASLLPEKA